MLASEIAHKQLNHVGEVLRQAEHGPEAGGSGHEVAGPASSDRTKRDGHGAA